MNMNQTEIANLKRQIHLMWQRVRSLENCIKIADPESCPAPVPISEKTLTEHKEELFNAHSAIELLRIELNEAKTHAENWKSGWDSMKSRGDEFEKERDKLIMQRDALAEQRASLRDKNESQEIVIKEYREKFEKLSREIERLQSNADGANRHINELAKRLVDVRKERDSFKLESDNQAAAWKEIHTFVPDVPGLSMVGMVRRHVEELTAERNALQVEYESRRDWIAKMLKILDCENVDGRDCRDAHLVAQTFVFSNTFLNEKNIELERELADLKANNRYQKGYGDGAGAVIKQVRDLAAKLKA